MSRLAVLLGLISYLAFPIAGAAEPDAYTRLEGVWGFHKVEVDGATQPEAAPATNKMVIGPRGAYLVLQGPRVTRGVIRLDAESSPARFDVEIAGGALRFESIYRLEDDHLHLCASYRGGPRPTAFETRPDSGLILHDMQRLDESMDKALDQVARQELKGLWRPEPLETVARAGEPAGNSLEFLIDDEGAFCLRRGYERVPFAVRALQYPPELDFGSSNPAHPELTTQAIYKVNGGVLTICEAAPGKPRPRQFQESADQGQRLTKYRRTP